MKETWLVTGSSVGFGRSIVGEGPAEGHNVVATARHPRTLDDLASQFPDQLLAQRPEVTDGRNARDVVEATIERFGRLDVLVNNAGFAGVGSIEKMPLDLIEQQFDTNFMGAIHACKAALPTMRAQRQGRIILIPCTAARLPPRRVRRTPHRDAWRGLILCVKGRRLGASRDTETGTCPTGYQGHRC